MISSSAKLPSYRRLKHDHDDDYEKPRSSTRSASPSVRVVSNWCRLKLRKVHIRRRLRKLKVPSLRRLLVLRRKIKLVSALRVSCRKVVKRFKEGQPHFGDLFAGNYLFLQINPSSLNKVAHVAAAAHHHHHHHLQYNGLSSTYVLPPPSNNNK